MYRIRYTHSFIDTYHYCRRHSTTSGFPGGCARRIEAVMRNEDYKRQMTTKEMQCFIDKAMDDGLSYQDSLVLLARAIGLHPSNVSLNTSLAEMWMEMRFS